MKVFILLCVFGAAFAGIPEARECPENQHYEQCGTACPLTCKNYLNPPKFCVLMCVSGCACDKGYVKTSDGRCVEPEQCPSEAEQVCGENQLYKECGTACPLTCDNYNNPPKICPAMCVPGCHCAEGYVKTSDGRCVRPEQCSKVCGENQLYKECGTACPLTCDNYNNPPKICPAMCVSGCHCAEGYVKTSDGRCVRPEQCSSENSVCELPGKVGLCRGYFPRYFFNRETRTCTKFIYGGCNGNKNNFRTMADCKAACGDKEEPQQALNRPDCDKAPETGLCRGNFPRFYYDQAEGMCKKFVYGGCGGNRNNFETEFDCYNKCGALMTGPKACQQEKDTGPCKAIFPRHFFNKQTGQCEEFIYGGCQGNDNNFQSKEDCESICL